MKYANYLGEETSVQIWFAGEPSAHDGEARERRIGAVQEAISKLTPLEQTIVQRVQLEGASLPEVGDALGIDTQTLQSIHRRAVRRLRKALTPFVAAEFKITQHESRCVICNSEHRVEIDELLAQHPCGNFYREIMREIRDRFGVVILSAMTIIGHRKYHG